MFLLQTSTQQREKRLQKQIELVDSLLDKALKYEQRGVHEAAEDYLRIAIQAEQQALNI